MFVTTLQVFPPFSVQNDNYCNAGYLIAKTDPLFKSHKVSGKEI